MSKPQREKREVAGDLPSPSMQTRTRASADIIPQDFFLYESKRSAPSHNKCESILVPLSSPQTEQYATIANVSERRLSSL